MLIEVIASLKESEIVLCLAKMVQTAPHNNIESLWGTSSTQHCCCKGSSSSPCDLMHPTAPASFTCPGSLPEALRASHNFSFREFGWSTGCFHAQCVCVHWGFDMTTALISQDTTIACDHCFSLQMPNTYFWEVVALNASEIYLFISHCATWYTWRPQIFGRNFPTVRASWFSFSTEEDITVKLYVSAVLHCILRVEYVYVAFLVCF